MSVKQEDKDDGKSSFPKCYAFINATTQCTKTSIGILICGDQTFPLCAEHSNKNFGYYAPQWCLYQAEAKSKSEPLFCPGCGGETETLHEGYCEVCCAYNQQALDRYNVEYDQWCKKTQFQKDEEIGNAIKRGIE